MVFSLWSEKCLKAVEGHTYYNKTKGRNNRASILKSSDIQHIIALVISVWIRRAAEGRRHLNPAVLFSIHNERDAGSCSPAPFCHRVVSCVKMPGEDNSLPAYHGSKCSVCGWPQWHLWCHNLHTLQIIYSQARLWGLQPTGPFLTNAAVKVFLYGIGDQSQIRWSY